MPGLQQTFDMINTQTGVAATIPCCKHHDDQLHSWSLLGLCKCEPITTTQIIHIHDMSYHNKWQCSNQSAESTQSNCNGYHCCNDCMVYSLCYNITIWWKTPLHFKHTDNKTALQSKVDHPPMFAFSYSHMTFCSCDLDLDLDQMILDIWTWPKYCEVYQHTKS